VALPKLFAERLAGLTQSPALLGVIAACVYVFRRDTQYTIGMAPGPAFIEDGRAASSPLCWAPLLYLRRDPCRNLPLILARSAS